VEVSDGPRYSMQSLADLLRCEEPNYPMPLIPTDRRGFTANLMKYGRRLHYEGLLTWEALLSTSLHFWELMPKEERPRGERWKVCTSAATAVYERLLDEVDNLPVKLSEDRLRMIRSENANRTNQAKRSRAAERLERVALLRAAGKTQKEIAEILGVSDRTIRNDLKKLH